MDEQLILELFIEPSQQGMYLLLPFSMPSNVERLALRYRYPRYQEREAPFGNVAFTSRQEINITSLNGF